jgi:hypothetical protein
MTTEPAASAAQAATTIASAFLKAIVGSSAGEAGRSSGAAEFGLGAGDRPLEQLGSRPDDGRQERRPLLERELVDAIEGLLFPELQRGELERVAEAGEGHGAVTYEASRATKAN